MKKRIITLMLSACMIAGAVATTVACQKPKPIGGGGNNTMPADNVAVIMDESGNVLDSDTIHVLPRGLSFVVTSGQALADPAGVTVTASVYPDVATDKRIDWIVAWAGESGGDVNNYITVTPSFDGSDIAVIKCLQPFNKSIKVTAVSRANANAKSDCLLDYVSKMDMSKFKVFLENTRDGTTTALDPSQINYLPLYTGSMDNIYAKELYMRFASYLGEAYSHFNINEMESYTFGSLPDIKSISKTIEMTEKGQDIISTFIDFDITNFTLSPCEFIPVPIPGDVIYTLSGQLSYFFNREIFSPTMPLETATEYMYQFDFDYQGFLLKLLEYADSEEPDYIITYTIDYNHSPSDTVSYGIAFNPADVEILVEGLDLDQDHIIFG